MSLSVTVATRPDWDEYGLGLAVAASVRGDCIRRKVGAVLMDQDHIIRGVGYNGSVPGGKSCLAGECPRCLDTTIPSGEQYENCIEIHSEDNCMRNSAANLGDPYGEDRYTMYITCEPCKLCQDLMYWNRIHRVVWPQGSYTNPFNWI